MAKRLDQMLVIDVEATCWEHGPPVGEESEIIELGLCPLDLATGERLHTRSILVRPERSTVSAVCTQLTTLTLTPGAERWVEVAYLPQYDITWYCQQGYAYVVASSDTWRQLAIPYEYARWSGAPPLVEFGGQPQQMFGPRLVVYRPAFRRRRYRRACRR